MTLLSALLFLIHLPLIELAHESTDTSIPGGFIRLPWDPQTPNINVVDPSAGQSLEETIAAVDPSEVKTLPQDGKVPGTNVESNMVPETGLDPLNQFPGTGFDHLNQFQPTHFDPLNPFSHQWPRRRRFWRRRQFLNGGMPNWRLNGRSPELGFGITGTSQAHGTPPHLENHRFPNGINNHHDHVESKNPGSKHTIHQQQTNEEATKLTDTGKAHTNTSNTKMDNPLGDVLKTLTQTVVSKLVDRLVDKVVNNQKPSVIIPGSSPHTGSGFSQPFVHVGHTHGPHGEVIPLSHGHSRPENFVPQQNQVVNDFGHRNRWSANPFLHPAVQGSRRGWMIG